MSSLALLAFLVLFASLTFVSLVYLPPPLRYQAPRPEGAATPPPGAAPSGRAMSYSVNELTLRALSGPDHYDLERVRASFHEGLLGKSAYYHAQPAGVLFTSPPHTHAHFADDFDASLEFYSTPDGLTAGSHGAWYTVGDLPGRLWAGDGVHVAVNWAPGSADLDMGTLEVIPIPHVAPPGAVLIEQQEDV